MAGAGAAALADDAGYVVVDGRDRHTSAVIRPGAGVTVNGEAPFTLHTRQWGELRVFFQGARVHVDTPVPPAAIADVIDTWCTQTAELGLTQRPSKFRMQLTRHHILRQSQSLLVKQLQPFVSHCQVELPRHSMELP